MMPKSFDKYGLLPPGDYELTLEELHRSLLVKGPVHKSPGWDSAWRRYLIPTVTARIPAEGNYKNNKINIRGD